MNDLRLEFRSRNNILWHMIFDAHRSVRQFCLAHGFREDEVGKLLNLKMSPYLELQDRCLRQTAQRLCDLSGLGRGELWPPDLYTGTIPRYGVAEIPSSRFLPLLAARHITLPAFADDTVFSQERAAVFEEVLKTLTPREEKVVRMRFGVGDGIEHTFEDVAKSLAVSCERIRQIEAKAMRKLRAPSRSRRIRQFLEE